MSSGPAAPSKDQDDDPRPQKGQRDDRISRHHRPRSTGWSSPSTAVSARSSSSGSVAIAFGLDPAWGMLTVPLIAWLAGFGWACFGILVAGFAKSIENFSYVVSAVLTPLFLVAGTFFPLDVRVGRLDGRRPGRGARGVRPRGLADRDPCDDAQADRLASVRRWLSSAASAILNANPCTERKQMKGQQKPKKLGKKAPLKSLKEKRAAKRDAAKPGRGLDV